MKQLCEVNLLFVIVCVCVCVCVYAENVSDLLVEHLAMWKKNLPLPLNLCSFPSALQSKPMEDVIDSVWSRYSSFPAEGIHFETRWVKGVCVCVCVCVCV